MEPRKRKTLLDLDRLPTQKELREFFLANDWSARKPYDFDKWSQEKMEDKNYTQNIFDKIWHKISRKHGQRLLQDATQMIIRLRFSGAM